MDNCKVCADNDCNGESVDIIKNACFDDVGMNSFVSIPLSILSTLSNIADSNMVDSTTTDYIKTIDSEFSFQLVEMTLFKFANSDESKYSIHKHFRSQIRIHLKHDFSYFIMRNFAITETGDRRL